MTIGRATVVHCCTQYDEHGTNQGESNLAEKVILA